MSATVRRVAGCEQETSLSRTLSVICDYVLAFFDRFLLERAAPQLDMQGKTGIYVLDSNAGSKVK
jgi:hypothetical protein